MTGHKPGYIAGDRQVYRVHGDGRRGEAGGEAVSGEDGKRAIVKQYGVGCNVIQKRTNLRIKYAYSMSQNSI